MSIHFSSNLQFNTKGNKTLIFNSVHLYSWMAEYIHAQTSMSIGELYQQLSIKFIAITFWYNNCYIRNAVITPLMCTSMVFVRNLCPCRHLFYSVSSQLLLYMTHELIAILWYGECFVFNRWSHWSNWPPILFNG